VADKEPAESPDESTPADDLVQPDAAGPTEPSELADAEPTNAELVEEGALDSAEDDETSDREPVTVGAPRAAGTKKVASGSRRAEPEAKGRPTRRRGGADPAKRRTGPVTFVKQSVGELRKVVYPTGQQLLNYFVVVLIFVLFIIAYVSLLDLGFGAAMFRIFA